MYYSNTIYVPDNSPENFWGVLVILSIVLIIYAVGSCEITKRRIRVLEKAKRVATETINTQKDLRNKGF